MGPKFEVQTLSVHDSSDILNHLRWKISGKSGNSGAGGMETKDAGGAISMTISWSSTEGGP